MDAVEHRVAQHRDALLAPAALLFIDFIERLEERLLKAFFFLRVFVRADASSLPNRRLGPFGNGQQPGPCRP